MFKTEKQLENAILEYLTVRHIFAWKNQTTGVYDVKKGVFRKSYNQFHKNGIPDIIGFHKEKTFFIEVKRPLVRPRAFDALYKALSDDQKDFYLNAKKRNIPILIADNLDSVFDFIGQL